MKIIASLFFIFSILYNKAQGQAIDLAPAVEMNKFVGTWLWVNGNDTLKIYIKVGVDPKISDSIGFLMGSHDYIKNGVKVANFYKTTINSLKDCSLSGSVWTNNQNRMEGTVRERPIKRLASLYLDYLTPNTIKFSVMSLQGVKIRSDGSPKPSSVINLPSGIILTKL